MYFLSIFPCKAFYFKYSSLYLSTPNSQSIHIFSIICNAAPYHGRGGRGGKNITESMELIVCKRDPRAGEIRYRATQDVREGAGLQEKLP